VDDKSGGPAYLVNSWLEVCEWMGRGNLTVIYLCTAICRFYMTMGQGDSVFRVDDLTPAVPDK
jgi:uncharacterized protein YodC (DUF2158 family)